MAAAARKLVEVKTSTQPKKRSVRLANDQDQSAPSPALERQMALLDQLAAADDEAAPAAKWSQRRTAAFLLLTCGSFWTCAIWGVARLFK